MDSFTSLDETESLASGIEKIEASAINLAALLKNLKGSSKPSIIALSENISQSMKKLEANVTLLVEDERGSSILDQSTFQSLSHILEDLEAYDWLEVRHILRDEKSRVQSLINTRSGAVRDASRQCELNGMGDGMRVYKLHQDLLATKAMILSDDQLRDVQRTIDEATVKYVGRYELILSELKHCSDQLEVGSKQNEDAFVRVHGQIVEILEFDKFDKSFNGHLRVQGRIEDATSSLIQYSTALSTHGREICLSLLENASSTRETTKKSELEKAAKCLDNILLDITAMETFDFPRQLKENASKAKQAILGVFDTFRESLRAALLTPFQYTALATLLGRYFLVHELGCKLVNQHMPSQSFVAAQTRKRVSDDAEKVESIAAEAVDTEKIDGSLKALQMATVLDCFINGEATKTIRRIKKLVEKQNEDRDQLLQDMIDQKNFKRIGPFLKPLQKSKDVVDMERFNQYRDCITTFLRSQIQNAKAVPVPPAETEADYLCRIVNDLKIANSELGSFLKDTDLNLPKTISSIEKQLKEAFDQAINDMHFGMKNLDFYVIWMKSKRAKMLVDKFGEVFSRTQMSRFQTTNTRCQQLLDDMNGLVDRFVESSFTNFRDLGKALSSLKSITSDDYEFSI